MAAFGRGDLAVEYGARIPDDGDRAAAYLGCATAMARREDVEAAGRFLTLAAIAAREGGDLRGRARALAGVARACRDLSAGVGPETVDVLLAGVRSSKHPVFTERVMPDVVALLVHRREDEAALELVEGLADPFLRELADVEILVRDLDVDVADPASVEARAWSCESDDLRARALVAVARAYARRRDYEAALYIPQVIEDAWEDSGNYVEPVLRWPLGWDLAWDVEYEVSQAAARHGDVDVAVRQVRESHRLGGRSAHEVVVSMLDAAAALTSRQCAELVAQAHQRERASAGLVEVTRACLDRGHVGIAVDVVERWPDIPAPDFDDDVVHRAAETLSRLADRAPWAPLLAAVARIGDLSTRVRLARGVFRAVPEPALLAMLDDRPGHGGHPQPVHARAAADLPIHAVLAAEEVLRRQPRISGRVADAVDGALERLTAVELCERSRLLRCVAGGPIGQVRGDAIADVADAARAQATSALTGGALDRVVLELAVVMARLGRGDLASSWIDAMPTPIVRDLAWREASAVAIDRGDLDASQSAMENITATAMRDRARRRLIVGHLRHGDVTTAVALARSTTEPSERTATPELVVAAATQAHESGQLPDSTAAALHSTLFRAATDEVGLAETGDA